MACITSGGDSGSRGLHHRGQQVLSVCQQTLVNKRTRALYHWFAVAMTEIFQDRVRDQLIAPACGDNYVESQLITGVRELNRCGRQRRKQHVIADYCD